MTPPAPDRRTVLRAALATGAGLVAAACGRRDKPAPQAISSVRPTPSPTPTSTQTSPSSAPQPGVTPSGPAVEILHGPRDAPRVALTFHGSGSATLALALVDAAEAGGAHLTVFAVGTWLQQQGAVLARLVDGGHELANHTLTHPSLRRLNPTATLAEITDCRDILVKTSGAPGRFFRPSGTPRATTQILTAAGQAGYATSLAYDVDPQDYRDPGARAVRQRILAAVQPGSIISLHLGHAGTVEALPAVLSGLAARGLTAVTASALLPP